MKLGPAAPLPSQESISVSRLMPRPRFHTGAAFEAWATGLALPSDCTSCLHQLKSTVKLQQERQGYQHLVQEETDSAMRAKAQMLCVSVAGEHLPGGCAHDRRPGNPADSSSDPTGLEQEAPRQCSLSSGSANRNVALPREQRALTGS